MRRTLWILWAAGCGSKAPADAAGSQSDYAYLRTYGDTIARYRLETVQFQNGERVGRKIGLSEHTPTKEGEQIRWIGLQEEIGGALVDDPSHALVAPYPVSLLPEGALELPEHGAPKMTSLIKDLLTFWVAVGTVVDNDAVVRVGDTWTPSEPFLRDWADAVSMPVGRDCLQPTTTMTALQRGTARYQTTFEPPDQPCASLQPALATLAAHASAPVVPGHPDNFVQTSTDGRSFSALWGMKSSTVSATVSTTDGRILGATLDLRLQLKLLECDTEAMEGCEGPFPMDLRRRLTLQQKL